MGEGPDNSCCAKAASYFRILINVALIIVINEVVPEGLAENHPGKRCQQDGDANSDPAAIHFNERLIGCLAMSTAQGFEANSGEASKIRII